jgi:transcriptional regulator with XRE-family HTH domain
MKPRKTARRQVFHGLGFPVILRDAPMVKLRGEWALDVDYRALARCAAVATALKPGRLTGAEARFIRHHLGLTLQRAAERLGVTHPAVFKWESRGASPARMGWATEKEIRLAALRAERIAPRLFLRAWEAISRRMEAKPGELTLRREEMEDAGRLARERLAA